MMARIALSGWGLIKGECDTERNKRDFSASPKWIAHEGEAPSDRADLQRSATSVVVQI